MDLVLYVVPLALRVAKYPRLLPTFNEESDWVRMLDDEEVVHFFFAARDGIRRSPVSVVIP